MASLHLAHLGPFWALTLVAIVANGPAAGQQQQEFAEVPANYPYYMQSPIQSQTEQQQIAPQAPPVQVGTKNQEDKLSQRANIPTLPGQVVGPLASTVVGASGAPINKQQNELLIKEQSAQQQINRKPLPNCMYDKRYFAKFDECLSRKPYPTIGLPAFKNEDLLIKRGLSDRHGCVFILSNGLFKNYQISKYSVDSDSACLDGSKVQLSMHFSNVTLYYLWTLRCLNYADQLLDDATLNGKTTNNNDQDSAICVGSSQNFGFTSIQLTNLEAQVELATDIYKNWRLTNVTVAMLNHNLAQAVSKSSTNSQSNDQHHQGQSMDSNESPLLSSGIRDFTFESLDGDELNWRYLHLFQNWSRNRMHSNFLDQYKRFLWISLQRCLSESSEKLPVKLVDIFGQHKYN